MAADAVVFCEKEQVVKIGDRVIGKVVYWYSESLARCQRVIEYHQGVIDSPLVDDLFYYIKRDDGRHVLCPPHEIYKPT